MSKIIECFISIQGEGKRTGHPALFIRYNFCNLRCVFRDKNGQITSRCDTYYTSFDGSESKDYISEDMVIKLLEDNPKVMDIVITGGEPLIHQSSIVDLIKRIKNINEYYIVTIETNGTIRPNMDILDLVDLWSVSPKLESSCPDESDMERFGITKGLYDFHRNNRINITALSDIYANGYDCQFKFVYTGRECIKEIEEIADKIQKNTDVHEDINKYIMLMPEGIDSKSISEKSDEVVQVCIEKGWIFSTRMHILIWGNMKEK